jgi:hypothetical protein
MSADLNKRKKRRTIVLEQVENGVRITVEEPPYLVKTGTERTRNLSTLDITELCLSDFTPDKGEDRAVYSTKWCTDTGSLHGSSAVCDGLCHDLECFEPAAFFHHWKGIDGKERCIPLCKWHAHDLNYYVGRAVLWALKYGVVEDLRFWIMQDPLPGGLPRCDYGYYAVDSDGDSEKARCTNEATTKVRVTELRPAGEVYEAKLCDACVERETNRSDALDNEHRNPRHRVEIISALSNCEGPVLETSNHEPEF